MPEGVYGLGVHQVAGSLLGAFFLLLGLTWILDERLLHHVECLIFSWFKFLEGKGDVFKLRGKLLKIHIELLWAAGGHT